MGSEVSLRRKKKLRKVFKSASVPVQIEPKSAFEEKRWKISPKSTCQKIEKLAPKGGKPYSKRRCLECWQLFLSTRQPGWESQLLVPTCQPS